MKLLGMIGGTSWHSTIDYYRLINELAGERMDGGTNPPLLLYSMNIAVMREMNIDKISKTYIEISQTLEKAGAEGIIICANTPHIVYSVVAPKIGIPILHIGDAVGMKAAKLGISTLGLLGTKPTMEKDFLKSWLSKNHNLNTLIPGIAARDEIHRLISQELTRGVFTRQAKDYMLEEMQKLKLQGAQGMILGCTELPLLIKDEDFDLPLLNTTLLHAEMAVNFMFDNGESA